jgi:hypothetical protein
MSAIELLSAWRGISLSKPPYILDGDEILIKNEELRLSYSCFEDYYMRGFNFKSPNKIHDGLIHDGLIPIPYDGDILRAKIYILTLNPGFGPHDYYAESYDTAFRKAKIQQLRQQLMDETFPFFGLNPLFSWLGGYRYWTTRLGDIIDKVSEQRNVPYIEALSMLSKSIACLEYIPYHSKIFGLKKAVVNKMRSPKLMKEFVDNYVVPRVKKERDDTAIIVTRHAEKWDLSEQPNIIVYGAGESRAAYLNSKSRGGKMIAKVMEITI